MEDLYERSTLSLVADKYHIGIQGKDGLGDQDDLFMGILRYLLQLK